MFRAEFPTASNKTSNIHRTFKDNSPLIYQTICTTEKSISPFRIDFLGTPLPIQEYTEFYKDLKYYTHDIAFLYCLIANWKYVPYYALSCYSYTPYNPIGIRNEIKYESMKYFLTVALYEYFTNNKSIEYQKQLSLELCDSWFFLGIMDLVITDFEFWLPVLEKRDSISRTIVKTLQEINILPCMSYRKYFYMLYKKQIKNLFSDSEYEKSKNKFDKVHNLSSELAMMVVVFVQDFYPSIKGYFSSITECLDEKYPLVFSGFDKYIKTLSLIHPEENFKQISYNFEAFFKASNKKYRDLTTWFINSLYELPQLSLPPHNCSFGQKQKFVKDLLDGRI